jgi:hypothetical protein
MEPSLINSILNSQLFGIIIGALLTICANWLSHHYSLKKEKEQWLREQNSKKEEWKKEESEKIREILKNALSSISSFISLDQNNNLEGKEDLKSEKVNDILEWFSLIVLRYPNDEKLKYYLENFSYSPNSGTATTLKEKLNNLVISEGTLFINKAKEASTDNADKKDFTLRFRINDDFRKELMIESGKILNKYQSIMASLSEINREQRGLLISENFNSRSSDPLPKNIDLQIHATSKTAGSNIKKNWEAKLDPTNLEINHILKAWEKDFKESKKDA